MGERIGSVIPSNTVATGVNTPILGIQLRIALAIRTSISTCAITVTKKLIVIRNAPACSLCHTVQRITVSSSIRYTNILQFGYAYHNPFLSFNSPFSPRRPRMPPSFMPDTYTQIKTFKREEQEAAKEKKQ